MTSLVGGGGADGLGADRDGIPRRGYARDKVTSSCGSSVVGRRRIRLRRHRRRHRRRLRRRSRRACHLRLRLRGHGGAAGPAPRRSRRRARFIRSSLGRELPPFSVSAYADVEAIIRAYAESAPTSADNARDIWTRGTSLQAGTGFSWFGPLWFSEQQWEANLKKIAVHETFHVLQNELAGLGATVEGFDDLPRRDLVGCLRAPRRARGLSGDRGYAPYDHHSHAGRLGATRRSSAGDASTPRHPSRAVRGGEQRLGIMPLAVERLRGRGRSCKAAAAYFEAIRPRQSMAVGVRQGLRSAPRRLDQFEASRRGP